MKRTTLRLFLDLAMAKSWPLHQLDINNAFLGGFIDKEIHMHASSRGYTKALPRQVRKSHKSKYGLE